MNKTEAALSHWIGFISRNAAMTVAAIGALTVVIGLYAVHTITINTDTEDMLSPELPFRQNTKAMDIAFPQFNDNIVIVLDGENADLVADAAMLLTRELGMKPELYGPVFDPDGLEFFARNGFLYLSKIELVELVERLNDAQPFIGRLWNDPTLPGLFATLRLILGETKKATDKSSARERIAALSGILESTEEVVRAAVADVPKFLSWRRLIAGEDGFARRTFRTIIIKPYLNYDSLQPGSEVIDALRSLFLHLRLTEDYHVRARLTGPVVLDFEELESVVDGLGLAGILSFALVIVLLIWGLKNLKLAAGVLVTLVAGLVWTAGFAALAVGTLNLISVAFAVLFIGLSVDFGIHFALRYKETAEADQEARGALVKSGGQVGGALILSATAAAIGFLAFVPTDYAGLAELGVIAGGGMVIALAANLTLLPALLVLMPLRGGDQRAAIARPRDGTRRRWTWSFGWLVIATGIAGLFFMPLVRFDFDPLNLKNRQMESVATLFDLMEANGQGPYQIKILAKDVGTAGRLAAKLGKLASVKSAVSINDLVPGEQDTKLEIAETLGFTLAPSLSLEPERSASSHEDRLLAFQNFRQFLEKAGSSGPIRNLAAALEAFAAGVQGNPDKLRQLEVRLMRTLLARLDELRLALDLSPIESAALPLTLKSRQVAADGRALVIVKPEGDLRDRKALARFVAEVRTLAPGATGSPVTILEAGRVVITAFIQAALLAFTGITILVFILTKNPREILLIFAPLLAAASLTMVVSVLAALPFNFANVIVLPLLFGLGIASAIHLVMREKSTGSTSVDNGGAMATSTPRAVVFSALTTIGSFASVSLSGHPGTASMGVLLTIAITLTLISTLTVLPVLLKFFPLRQVR